MAKYLFGVSTPKDDAMLINLRLAEDMLKDVAEGTVTLFVCKETGGYCDVYREATEISFTHGRVPCLLSMVADYRESL